MASYTVSPVLTPSNLKIANEVVDWARNFLIPDSEIKRPVGSQSVCPFVAPSLDNDCFYIAFHDELNHRSENAIENVVTQYIKPFKNMPPFLEREVLKALIVVFPAIEERHAGVLSRVAANVKPAFVSEKLMLAPFYKNCSDTSVYNKKFLTSQAPHSFIAIRHMAIHDILFLNARVEWFDAYNRHFGDYFRNPGAVEAHNQHLVGLYHETKKKFQIT